MQKEYWFPRKTYGYGWGAPSNWKGWVVLLSYIALTTVPIFFVKSGQLSVIGLTIVQTVLTTILVAICIWKGEPTKWSRGNRDKSQSETEN